MTIRGTVREVWGAGRASATVGLLLGVLIAVETARRNGFHTFGDVVRLTAALAFVFGLLTMAVGVVVGIVAAAVRSRRGGTSDSAEAGGKPAGAATAGEISFATTVVTVSAVWVARWFEFTWAYPHRWDVADDFAGMLAVALAFLSVLLLAATLGGMFLTRVAVRARWLCITPLRAVGVCVVVALGAATLFALRHAPAPDPAGEAAALPVVSPNGNRVLLVGCDGADDRVIDTLLAEGELPVLRQLIDAGVRAPLRTIRDHPSPALWTSIASSRPPSATGIADFYVQHVLGAATAVTAFPRHFGLNSGLLLRDVLGRRAIRVTPVGSSMVRARRLWEILAAADVRTGVVNWLVTWPVQAGDAEFLVSDRTWSALSEGVGVEARLWDPPGLGERMPRGADLPESEDAFVTTVTRQLVEELGPQVTIAYFRDVDAAEHLSWDDWEPRYFRGRGEAPARRGAVRDAYLAFDRHLGELINVAGPEITVIVVSDHGHDPWFTWFGRGTPGGHTYAPPGIFVAAGPGIRPGAVIDTAPTVYDVTPTLLQIVGLPAAADMEGRVLREILAEDAPLTRIATWEAGRTPGAEPPPGIEDEAMMERLRALGYLR